MFRIAYTTQGAFDAIAWADSLPEAQRKAAGLAALKHVSNVRILEGASSPLDKEDRYVFCQSCNFVCKLSQLPRGFALDNGEDDCSRVWCRSWPETDGCEYSPQEASDA